MSKLLVVAAACAIACGGKPPTSAPPDLAPRPPPPDETVTPPPAEPALPLWSAVRRGTLPNGLTYYVLPNKKPENRVLLWLAVNAGSVQEDDDQRGLAHFVEHMAFNGTKRFPKHDIIHFIEGVGLRFGADLNAYTSWDETVYTLEVPADDPQHLAKGLDVLRDWSADVAFDPKEIDLERGVVLEEWRLGLGAGRRLFDKHVKVVFEGTRYADRVVIGLADTLRDAPHEALVRYYKDWYRPDLMAVIVVGDIADPAAIEREITARFSDLAKPDRPRPRPSGGVPAATGTRVSIETDHEYTTQNVSVSNLFAHRAEATTSDYRRSIVERVYTQMFNERLRSLARRPESPFVGAFTRISDRTRDIDEFARSATVRGGDVEGALRALFLEVLRVEQHGFTQAELERARLVIARQAEQAVIDAPTARSRPYAQELVRNFFEGEFVIGPEAERDFTLKTLPQITLAELHRLSTSFGGAESRVITISGPDGKPLPTRERILALIEETQRSQLEPWVDRPPPSALMATPPTPGTIVKETANPRLGTTEWTLGNGARVIVKPTDFEADAVMLSGSSPGGLAMASAAIYPHARFADTIAALGGVGELDSEDLGRVLAGKQASARTAIHETTETVSGRASARDLETMLQLVHLRITAPRKDEPQIALWRENYKEQLENRERSPDYQFGKASSGVLWKNHPRRAFATPADVAKLDADKALAFYRDRFGDATDFTFVIVGTVDLATLRPLVETYLASLPTRGRKEQERDPGARRVAGVVKKTWQLGQEPKARVSLLFHGDQRWTRDHDRDMYLVSRALGMRLREVMREDKGGVYGVGASGYLTRRPRQERSFSISFGADPGRVDELIAVAREQIAAIAKDGVDEAVLDKIRKGFERDRELQLRSNAFWLGWLEGAARYGDDPELVLDPAPMLARMTNANLKAATRRYLDGKRLYQAIMLPAATATPAKPAKPARPKRDPKVVPGAERSPDDKIVPGAEKP
jgi:zinc protease